MLDKKQRQIVESALRQDKVYEHLVGLSADDRGDEEHEATIADIMDLWHMVSFEKWSADSIPGMSGTVHFLWYDVPGEPVVLLERSASNGETKISQFTVLS